MPIILILFASILLQFIAGLLALRLVWITRKAPAWLLIALALFLMALRRGITLYHLLFLELPAPLDATAELVALIISLCMVIGVAWIGPLFLSFKRSEEMLRRQMMQSCMDGIVANDMAGNIISFNETAGKILGYQGEEVIGKMKVGNLYPPGVAQEIKRKINDPGYGGQGILENYETLARQKNGTLIPIWLSARIFSEDSQEAGIVGHFRDLRERKRLEEELLRNERLSSLGRMAAHISHEIKNPLMLIGGFARQVLKAIPEDSQKNREKLQIVVDETVRLEDFLSEVGSYAKISEPEKQKGDLNALVQETCRRLEPFLQESGIELRLNLDPDIPPVGFDPVHLRQVILNIAKNGIEAMTAGGTLTVTSGQKPGQIFVQVSDTGEGMAPEVLEKIFHPFYSTKPKGSGLGLAISQKIMEAHQGEITVESQLHQGSRVTISLTIAA